MTLNELVRQRARHELISYDPIYNNESDWKLLPAIDQPEDPARCLISGTGLTHLGSARNRQSMHAKKDEDLTDSMKMFRLGVEGCLLRAHGEPLEIPSYAEDGGEEAEIAGVYVIGPNGQPYRVGLAVGNEFSDHQFEKKNYLNLAGSKLRSCALGPELVIDPCFDSVPVAVAIERDGTVFWNKTFLSGDAEMCHSLSNIEHHHFKYAAHRRCGDVHVHFLGTDCLSFSDNVRLRDGDIIRISAAGYGRPLANPVRVDSSAPALMNVIPLG